MNELGIFLPFTDLSSGLTPAWETKLESNNLGDFYRGNQEYGRVVLGWFDIGGRSGNGQCHRVQYRPRFHTLPDAFGQFPRAWAADVWKPN